LVTTLFAYRVESGKATFSGVPMCDDKKYGDKFNEHLIVSMKIVTVYNIFDISA
jgi:hypothetical protein